MGSTWTAGPHQVTSAGATSSPTATGLMASFVVRLTSRGQLRRLSLHLPGMRSLIAICRKCKCKCSSSVCSQPPPTFLCDCNLSKSKMTMILPRPRVIAAANIPWPVCMIPSVSLCGPGRLQCTLSMSIPCRLLVLLDLCVLIHYSLWPHQCTPYQTSAHPRGEPEADRPTTSLVASSSR
ncbi:hypothetical protein BKA80DRAFT_270158 [Phyllosticta citrichinensis]